VSTPAQTVADLRTLVTRRAGVGRRVALLSGDAALVGALEQNRCTVLVDPASSQELAAFDAQVVVAFDGFATERAQSFALLRETAPNAELVFSFANAASASGLLRSLLGAATGPGLAEAEVRAWLASSGYVVTARDVVVTPHAASGLSADTEASVRALFEQLNPDSAIDRLLLVAKRGVAASKVDRERGLTSVVISAGADVPALEGTLGALVAQSRRPLELVVVSALGDEALERALGRVRGRAGVTLTPVTSTSQDPAARSNAGLQVARGQYVACFEAGDLPDALHLGALAQRLEQGTNAWALAMPAEPVKAPFKLAQWLEVGAVNRARWLVDRERLGAFALTFPEGSPLFEHALFTRLALLFPPAFSEGPVTVDSTRAAVADVRGLLDALRGRPLRTLVSLEGLFERPSLSSLVQERLEAVRPGAGDVLGRALDVVRRRVGR
jgi:hypothetical protein